MRKICMRCDFIYSHKYVIYDEKEFELRDLRKKNIFNIINVFFFFFLNRII